jgi:hypothetical protein
MNKIYQTSESVLIWLGRDDNRLAEKVSQLLRDLQVEFRD